ncbi:unnamed protein product [Linum tenue]|uniref:Uncharacterized protein n=1 Tax=Linum tenue TaxID=586396 RepID=A0AAV0HVN2_9ROSI|nr:unnamed protein product [Linum tenue]
MKLRFVTSAKSDSRNSMASCGSLTAVGKSWMISVRLVWLVREVMRERVI